jgi:CheY-like chemotaxis protein
LTYIDRQVTFAISPLIRGISLARKILLADDSVTAQNMGRKILADAGYEVIAVNNGSAALKKIAELKPDLVILDVYMPGYSGLEVCQRLKESPETARIPVLLTVGKLEPFKPEEAQRVRAEGFIVKPFEASELLSTLSKLEDKVVPRAEPSKPGRFARAIAAAEETERGSRDEAPSTDSTDTGWKSRIGFPKKKTEPEEKVADEAPVYTPVARDLSPAAETPLEKAAERIFKSEEARPQSAEVVSAGLPKDVTPEEFAAIAAVAAQMQAASAARKDESQVSPTEASSTGVSSAEATPAQATAQVAETQSHASLESAPGRSETTLPSAPAHDDPAPRVEAEAKAEIPAESKKEESKPGNAADDVAATQIYRRRKDDVIPEETQDIPVTIAATAESVVSGTAGRSRWTAVSVALEGSEAAISLDDEMQNAHAALAPTASAAVAAGPEVESAPAGIPFAKTDAVAEPPAAISNPEPERAQQPEPAVNEAPASASSLVTTEPVSFPQTASAVQQPESASPASITAEVPAVEVPAETSPKVEFAEPIQTQAAVIEAVHPAAEPEVAAPAASGDRESESRREAESAVAEAGEPTSEPKLDSEVVKTTAAAWANWRQTRDTGNFVEAAEAQPNEPDVAQAAPPDTAAMAAAAGAQQMLHEASSAAPSGETSNVASIVDSVLADLRPKLMAEISRKMSEKK